MAKPILTRYLYLLDEVKYSLLTSLLKGKDFQECLFWLSELYYSGFQEETVQFIWKTYYDFYSIHNPKLEVYLHKKHLLWSQSEVGVCGDGNIVHIVNMIRNMFGKKICPKVFILRQSLELYRINKPQHLPSYRGKKPKWLLESETYQPVYYNLLQALHKKHWIHFLLYLVQLVNKGADLPLISSVIHQYYKNKREKKVKKINKNKNRFYSNGLHAILVLVMRMEGAQDIDTRRLFIIANQEDLDFISHLNYVVSPIWKTLPQKRKYQIHDNVCSFNLERFSDTIKGDIRELLWYNWEYYASFAPLWKKRLELFQGVVDHNKRQINFPTDELLENFGEKYGYEPDEQSLAVQENGVLKMQKKTWRIWYDDIFADFPPIIPLQGKEMSLVY